jgi:rhodanese-related sulfurtransferase
VTGPPRDHSPQPMPGAPPPPPARARPAAATRPDEGEIPAVDQALTAARTRIGPRLRASEFDAALAAGTLVVDTRPSELRSRDGGLEGAVVVERNVLEWRLDPTSPHRLAQMTDPAQAVVVVCDEGYASSLAAAALMDLGLTNVTDLEGGYQAWRSDRRKPTEPAPG